MSSNDHMDGDMAYLDELEHNVVDHAEVEDDVDTIVNNEAELAEVGYVCNAEAAGSDHCEYVYDINSIDDPMCNLDYIRKEDYEVDQNG